MKIAVLGPKGSFSHEVAKNYDKTGELVFEKTIWYVFTAVKQGKADIAIVPIENSVSGSVSATLDCLMDFDLNIIKEIILPIKHNLAGFGKLEDIEIIYAHPQALSQCEKYLRRYLPEAEIRKTSSNSRSAEIIAQQHDKKKAAIIPLDAANIYSLSVIKKNIQDSPFNVTRFLVISKSKTEPTNKDRCSIAVYPESDKPGLLYSLLSLFAKKQINLTKIESRPSKGKLGDYIFLIDFEGHEDEEKVKATFEKIKQNFDLKILGSYPRAY